MSFNPAEKHDYYHAIAEDYERYGQGAITDWLLGFFNVYKYLCPIEDKSVFDYGCGTGKFCRFLRDKGAAVIGADVSQDMLEVAQSFDSRGITYHHIRSGCLEFIPDSSIDYVTMTFVLCILNTPTEMEKIVGELHRVLKKDGKLVMLNVNWEQAKGREFVSFKPDPVDVLTLGQHLHVTLKGEHPIRVEEHFWSKAYYCSLFKKSGLTDITIEEPLAHKDDTEHRWLDEQYYSPFAIIVGKKP